MLEDDNDGREIEVRRPPLPEVFSELGIKEITPEDSFAIEYAKGFLTATVTHKTGSVEIIRRQVEGGFSEMSSYDPTRMDKDKRNQVILELSRAGQTQSQIARRIGFTQATVSNVLRKEKNKGKD